VLPMWMKESEYICMTVCMCVHCAWVCMIGCIRACMV
jgi:hypothetical protein